MLAFIVHYSFHFLVPLLVAYLFFKKQIWQSWLVFMLGMSIDLDHLLANPVFDPCRCSINYHPLHSYWAIAIYLLLLLPAKTRLLALGLLLHILADVVDCFMKKEGC